MSAAKCHTQEPGCVCVYARARVETICEQEIFNNMTRGRYGVNINVHVAVLCFIQMCSEAFFSKHLTIFFPLFVKENIRKEIQRLSPKLMCCPTCNNDVITAYHTTTNH